MKNLSQNINFVKNEFEEANFDKSTGLEADIISGHLKEMCEILKGEPFPIVSAKAYAYLLDNAQLEINEYTPFAVKYNFGIDYSYFATASIFYWSVLSTREAEVISEKLPVESEQAKIFAESGLDWMAVDFTHTVPDWNYLLKHGFKGILDNAYASKHRLISSGNCSENQIAFLDSVIICYEAILRLLRRTYTYSLKFNVPEFSQCIKNLLENPPSTLYEVMQFSVLYVYFEELSIERCRTLGPIDRLYYPFYENDKKNGTEEADLKELFKYYFMHFTAAKRFAQQPFTICGSDKDGNDFSNELSLIILEIYDELNIYDPKIHIRCHKNLDERIYKKAASMIRGGNNSICLIGDEAVFSGYEKIGIPREDSQNYVILGCYEPIIMGLEEAEISALRFNTVKCVEYAINGGKDIRSGKQVGVVSETEPKGFEEFLGIYLNQLDYCADFALDFIEKQGLYSTLIHPTPMYSSSFSECIEKGMDVHEYPLKYNNLSLKFHGLATTVDSLTAIKKYVFDRKEISFKNMRNALLNDWNGYEDLQKKIIVDKEKYGNNMETPDKILKDLTDHLTERYCAKELHRTGKVRLGLDSVYHCIKCGESTSATPDGRNKGKPVSKNLCACDGMDRNGITSYMQSVLKIDPAGFVDGVPFDFMLHPSAVEGEKGLEDFISLIKIFFANGGFAFQGNIVSGETLKEAQKNPEKYSTLQVRVCGWNEYFVNLSKVKQDMFIKQCEVM